MGRSSCVVCLGEASRSPRSLLHARSLSRLGPVKLLAYPPAPPNLPPQLTFVPLSVYPDELPRRLPNFLHYAIKATWQAINLLLLLFAGGRVDVVLCQNPPAIPTLFVCWLYCLIVRAKLVVDWHNYAHTIMALAHEETGLFVRTATWLEYYFGSKADAGFCVSQAMKNDLLQNHNIQCKLLYDCPPENFHPITIDEKHLLLSKLSKDYPIFNFQTSKKTTINKMVENITDEEKYLYFNQFESPMPDNIIERTCITEKSIKNITTMRSKRPGILFSSTSWTVDEDFMILLSALEVYDKTAMGDASLPNLICVITGKGPMKEFYIKLINSKRLQKVKVVTPWLEAADYPMMVASADLGVCLHTSSSGLDLPMKIVDMFGSGLPVCAYKYPCLSELVKEGENGFMFEDSDQLAEQITTWFKSFPNNSKQNEVINKFKNNLKTFQNLRWDSNWENRAKPLIM